MKSFPPKIEPAYFDLAGAQAYTGGALSVRTLRRLIAQPGGLPYHQVGRGKIIIRKSDLDAYLDRCRHEPVDLDALADQAVAELQGSR
jgi:excisionase family DNA binding protein